jgi:hypothetical protein
VPKIILANARSSSALMYHKAQLSAYANCKMFIFAPLFKLNKTL